MKQIRLFSNAVIVFSALSLGRIDTAHGARGVEPQSIPDFTQGGKKGDFHDWTLGPTGVRGWVYGSKGQTSDSRQILVTAVANGSPADGVLKRGDVILGVGNQPFNGDARIEFARAITAAEKEENGGRLRLTRWREGQTQNVQVKLAVMGSYGETAPYDCPKSKRIFELGCQAIAKTEMDTVSIPNDLNALALLASGREEDRALLASYAQKVAAYRIDHFATWYDGYAVLFLGEYALATHDPSVMPGLHRLAREIALGASAVGTWGHDFASPSGNCTGYGCMNSPGVVLVMALVLAREAGVKDPAVEQVIARGSRFLRWYVNKGALPYGDHLPWPGHEDNGKCSAAAVLFDLLGDREAAGFFARMATAAYDERERGHTGNFFNLLWALPAVSRCGPLATGAYWQHQLWYYDLARGWDDRFIYQGSPEGEEEHGKYTGWDSTGAYLLSYALPLKSLYVTGKKQCAVPPLKREEVREVIAAGRDYYPVNGTNGYELRQTDELLAGLASWSPPVRKRSAQALSRREGDFVPALLKLLAGSARNARYGACEALGCLGPRADAAAPPLRALLKDPDPWLESLACDALAHLSPGPRKSSVNDLLELAVRQHPDDPRGMIQRAVAAALFDPNPDLHRPGILQHSLAGVDRQLLYPAMQSLLQNDDALARYGLAPYVQQLTNRDLAVMLPSILKAVETMAPSDEMYGDGIRLAGLDLLSRLHIREGMPLCVSLIEMNRWGEGNRLPVCLKYLLRYGAHAKAVLPQLREAFRRTPSWMLKDHQKTFDQGVADIEAATDAPRLVDLKDFIAHASGKVGASTD